MSQQDSKLTLSAPESLKYSLQKEIAVLINQYEEERRQELYLDSKIKELELDLERKKNLKKNEENYELNAVCSSLKKKLEVYQVHFNTTQNENLMIRNKIDHMRIVTVSYKNKVKSLENDIEKSKALTKIKNEEQTKEKSQEHEKLSEIRLVMSKSANEKIRFTQKLEAISTVIKQEKNNNTGILKRLNENLDDILNKKLKVLDNTRIIESLSSRLESEIKKLNYKINKRKQHNKHLGNLFETIKCNTVNVSTTNEFVSIFLNFYDETTHLSKYLLEVLAEIESLEFANKKLEANYDESNQLFLSTKSKASKIHAELNQNIKKTYNSIHNSIKHQALLKEHLDKIKFWLKKSLLLAEFFDPLHTKKNSVEYETTEEYISLLEELIHSIKIFSLYSQKKEYSVKSITLSPMSNRRPTPEINVIYK